MLLGLGSCVVPDAGSARESDDTMAHAFSYGLSDESARRGLPQPRSGRASTAGPAGNGAPGFRLDLTRPHAHTVLFSLHGELDQQQTARLSELLVSRLRSLVHTLVLDCSKVSFLCVDTLELLNTCGLQARQAGITLSLATGPNNPAVRRALHAGNLDDLLTLGETVEDLLPAAAPSHEHTVTHAFRQRKPVNQHA